MRIFNRVAAGTSIAAMLLAVTPLVSFAGQADADLSQSTPEIPHTVSTSGAPHFAALLNAGTQQSMQLRQAALADPTGVEVAGVQIDGVPIPQTVSTSGSPMMAAMLNAGTSYSVSIRRGEIQP